MEVVRQINDELAIAGPVSVEQIQQLAEEGFQSVLNLRSIDNILVMREQQQVEGFGLRYLNLPIDHQPMSLTIANTALNQIDRLPKPILVYCNNAMLAAAIVLMHIAIQQGEPLPQAFKRAENLGLFAVPLHAVAH